MGLGHDSFATGLGATVFEKRLLNLARDLYTAGWHTEAEQVHGMVVTLTDLPQIDPDGDVGSVTQMLHVMENASRRIREIVERCYPEALGLPDR